MKFVLVKTIDGGTVLKRVIETTKDKETSK